MFFAEILGRTDTSVTYRYNLVPFKEIRRFITNYHQLGLIAVLANIVGNVVAFMPYGFCLPMVTEHKMKFFSVLFYTFALSLTIELIQLISKVGICDVDDLTLNTLGGILGYVMFCLFKMGYSRYKRKRKR
jgi:glycopeptide antibiotics resistance protein